MGSTFPWWFETVGGETCWCGLAERPGAGGLGRMWGSPWACWWSGGLGLLARCLSAMHSIPVRIGVPGVVALEYRRGLQVSFGAGKHVGRWAGQLSGGSQG